MKASEIEQQLWVIPSGANNIDDLKNAFHVKLFRALKDLQHKKKLVDCRKLSHKDARYFISDKESVLWILDLDAAGWNTSAAKALEMPTVLRGLSYESAIQSLSKYLFNVIAQRRNLAQEARRRCPAPLIIPISIPMPQQNGSMTDEKLFVMIPDEISTSLMNSLSEEQRYAFIYYLTSAWSLYFEQQHAVHGNIVIIHFPDQIIERLQRIIGLSEYKNISEVVVQATLSYLDRYDPNKKDFLVTVDGPATKKAIERGKFKDKKAAVIVGLQMLEKSLKKQFDEQM
jgi:hypothetical protein